MAMTAGKTIRFAFLLVILLGASSASGRAATLINLPTPAGLSSGDKFRFLFLTAGTLSATSADISSYNTFVTSQAAGARYDGTTVNWSALVSTSTVDARDNVGGLNTNVPVYLVNGTKLAGNLTTGTAANGLWSGVLLTGPDIGITGTSVGGSAYTGSLANGTGKSGNQAGASFTQYGTPTSGYQFGWAFSATAQPSSFALGLYGVSSELTVAPVPEPSTYAMGLAGLACSMWRRRKQA